MTVGVAADEAAEVAMARIGVAAAALVVVADTVEVAAALVVAKEVLRGGDRREGGGGDRRGGFGGDRGRGRPGGDRRDHRGGGRGGRDQNRDSRDNRLKGITAKVRATEDSLKALTARIKMSGRAFALFDLAKLILAGRERFEVVFQRQKEEDATPLVRCKADNSLWNSEEEAIQHFLSDRKNLETYYQIEETTTEGPKGNFTGIAVCGLSGQLLGPPNYHGYQTTVVRLHRQRFSNMPLDRYKSKIRTEANEELVEKWRAQQSTITTYLYPRIEVEEEVPAEEPVATEEAPQPQEEAKPEETETEAEASVESEVEAEATPPESETADEPTAEVEAETVEVDSPSEAADPPDVAESEPAAAEGEPAPVPEPEAEADAAPKPESAAPAIEQTSFDSIEALERHVRKTLANKIIVSANRSTVPGGIPGKQLTHGLLNILRSEVEQLKRSPFPLVKDLCGQFERAGLKIFKYEGKRLFVSKARPRPIDPDMPVSDGIRRIMKAVERENNLKVSELVTRLAPRPRPKVEPKPEKAEDSEAPEKSTEEAPASAKAEPKAEAKSDQTERTAGNLTAEEKAVLSDLHWLIDEGYIIEFTSSELHLGGRPRRKKKRPAKKKQAAKRATASKEDSPVKDAATAEAEIAEAEPEAPTTPVEEEAPKAEDVGPTEEEAVADPPKAEEPTVEAETAEEPAEDSNDDSSS